MSQIRIGGRTAVTIALSLEEAVHAGRFASDGVLPTVRSLATSLKVSPVTVAAAYRLLRSRGVAVGDRRRGTRIVVQTPTRRPFSSGSAREGLIDLASGNPDPALLPSLDTALRTLRREHHMYGEASSLPALARFAASEFEADNISAANVAVVTGALDGIDLVLREHLRPGDRVAVEDPVFPGVLDVLAASGFVPEPLTMDEEGPTPAACEAALKRQCRALLITPRAQNPTGAALSEDRTRELIRVLRRYPDVVIVENDYAGPIAGAASRTLCTGRTRWVVIRSVGKFLGPDLRVAVIAGDPLTIVRVAGRQSIGVRWVSSILQQLALVLWSDPSNGRLLAHAANVYEHRRSALVSALATHGIQAFGRSGFHVWIPVEEETRVVHGLAQMGWSVAPGERFRLRSAAGIRVTTATAMPAEAERFAADVAEVTRPAAVGFA